MDRKKLIISPLVKEVSLLIDGHPNYKILFNIYDETGDIVDQKPYTTNYYNSAIEVVKVLKSSPSTYTHYSIRFYFYSIFLLQKKGEDKLLGAQYEVIQKITEQEEKIYETP